MSKYYSPSLEGFIDDSIWDKLPEDAIQISETMYTDLREQLGDGDSKVILDGDDLKVVKLNRPITEEEIRSKRNKLLAISDWTQLPDSKVDKKKWSTYRQKLRDITKQKDFPHNVIWPREP